MHAQEHMSSHSSSDPELSRTVVSDAPERKTYPPLVDNEGYAYDTEQSRELDRQFVAARISEIALVDIDEPTYNAIVASQLKSATANRLRHESMEVRDMYEARHHEHTARFETDKEDVRLEKFLNGEAAAEQLESERASARDVIQRAFARRVMATADAIESSRGRST